MKKKLLPVFCVCLQQSNHSSLDLFWQSYDKSYIFAAIKSILIK